MMRSGYEVDTVADACVAASFFAVLRVLG